MDPFYSTERGAKPPDFRDIQLHNVFIATPGKITLLGLDAQHPLKVTMDGVHVAGLRASDIRAAHARIVVGAGGSNVKPSGEDVDVSDTPESKERPVVCGGEFVPFPAASAAHLGGAIPSSSARRAGRPFQDRTSTTVTVGHDGSGDYHSVQQAIDSLPDSGGLVRIRPGVYREVVTVTLPHVSLEGTSDPSRVTIAFDRGAGTAGGTPKSATVSVRADDFFARGITIANDFGKGRELAPQGSHAR